MDENMRLGMKARMKTLSETLLVGSALDDAPSEAEHLFYAIIGPFVSRFFDMIGTTL